MSDKRLVFIDKKKMGRNERLACEMDIARQQEEWIVDEEEKVLSGSQI